MDYHLHFTQGKGEKKEGINSIELDLKKNICHTQNTVTCKHNNIYMYMHI